MSNNEFTTREEPSRDPAQPQQAAPASKWAQDAQPLHVTFAPGPA